MSTPLNKPVIPIALCPTCGVETLLYGALDAATGALVRRCTGCDRIVGDGGDEAERAPDYYAAGELAGTPYDVTDALSLDGGCGGCGEEGCATCDHADTCTKH